MVTPMPGVYFDQHARMHIILAGARGYIVHSAEHSGKDVQSTIVSQCASALAIERRVGASVTSGAYNGHDCIEWLGGDKWRRPQVTCEQHRILTFRPYFPLTLLFGAALLSVCRRAAAVARRVTRRATPPGA